MRQILFTFLLLFSFLLSAQEVFLHEINSMELGQKRLIKIYVPESYDVNKERLYPLAVVMDGDYLFDAFVGNSKMFAYKDKAPEQIIVGIMQADTRYEDCDYDKVSGLPSDTGNKFYRFIRMELLDYMESNFRLSPFRTLVGDSFTANFLNYFVLENELAFDAFVAINPSYSPDMPIMLQNKLSMPLKQKLYYYTNSGKYHSAEKSKIIKDVVFLLKATENPELSLKYDFFETTSLTASKGQAISAALAHIFDIYSAISKEEFDANVKYLSPPDAIAYLEKKYVEIDYLFGTNMKIRERDIYAIESIVIDQDNGEYLVSFGEMIQKLYPESPLSDYYIGMFYEKKGKYKQALKNYKNGYAKFDKDSEDAEAFYQNIERVLNRQDEILLDEAEEEQQRELEKVKRKEVKEQEKENWKATKEKREAEKEKKRKEWEEHKLKEKEMMEQYRKKGNE